MKRLYLIPVVAFLLTASATFAIRYPSPLGHTRLTMPVAVATTAPAGELPSRVTVPHREHVTLTVPDWAPTPTAWRKDGEILAHATGRTLVIESASSEHAGFYYFDGLQWPHYSAGIQLQIQALGHFANFSARLQLQAGKPQVVGFFVAGSEPKQLLFRVTGPSLSQLGIDDFAPSPRIVPFNSRGERHDWLRIRAAIDWSKTFASVGAFPLTGGESAQAYDIGPFPPGAYTLVVEDASGEGGTVLVEVYEAPQGPVYLGQLSPNASP